jgi:murein DD-endopeptidase MepM/ murein hydrolase activator NlpD
MVDPRTAEVASQRCPHCGGSTHLRTRHVVIDGGIVRTYCSAECAANATAPITLEPQPPRRRFRAARLGYLLVAVVPLLVFTSGRAPKIGKTAPPPPALVVGPARAPASRPIAPDPHQFGPNWPPTDKEWMDEITSDAWIHPLDGPNRRMPVSDGRIFGAERPGDRPGECRSGHCGVDLSGPWGEPIHAVHDGLVDRVQRGPNEDHGGQYVRLSHRDGSLFSQYFHLAAIPRHLQPGMHVRVGDVIGLLGDTGVKESAAHLHFTLSVRASAKTERYIDPEPLIALWPLRIAVGESGAGVVTTKIAPGVPIALATKRHKKTAVAAKRKGEASAAPADEASPTD